MEKEFKQDIEKLEEVLKEVNYILSGSTSSKEDLMKSYENAIIKIAQSRKELQKAIDMIEEINEKL